MLTPIARLTLYSDLFAADPAGLINRCGGAVAGRVHGEFVDEYEGNLDHMGLPK